MCAASERSASEPESQPPIASATMTPAVIPSESAEPAQARAGVVTADAVRVRAVIVPVRLGARRTASSASPAACRVRVRSMAVGVAVRHSA